MSEHDGEHDEPLTELLAAVGSGAASADARLFERVYDDLHRLARGQFQREGPDHTLQPTALVNEAWIKLAADVPSFENQGHFFGAAARAMRQILVDHARKVQSLKRGGDRARCTLLDVDGGGQELEVLEIDDALTALEAHDERLAELVRLRFFAGLTNDEVARVTGRSVRTVKRDWTYTRAWLFAQMAEDDEDPGAAE